LKLRLQRGWLCCEEFPGEGVKFYTNSIQYSISGVKTQNTMNMAMNSDSFILLPDQTYTDMAQDIFKDDNAEYSDSNSNDDSEMSAEEYLKEMETILRKIRRRKRTKYAGTYIFLKIITASVLYIWIILFNFHSQSKTLIPLHPI
jgi:hypothetical protein